MIIKEAIRIGNSIEEVVGSDSNLLMSPMAVEQHRLLVAELKKVAPKSEEFLYFTCRAITAAEAANYGLDGKTIVGDGHFNHSGNWVTAKGIVPYMNHNGDVFGEDELQQSGHSFIGKGLFVNHKSDDVEKIRGIILDAIWVPDGKYIQVLCALDKIAHPTLARQIEQGYARDVSMGTAVKYSVCSKCGNKAVVEDDYCECVKNHKGGYLRGERIWENNFGLNFIELSLVTQGADPKAKIRQIIASMNGYLDKRAQAYTSGDLGGKDVTAEIKQIQNIASTLQEAVSTLTQDVCDENGLCKIASNLEASFADPDAHYPSPGNIPDGTGQQGIDQGPSQGAGDSASEDGGLSLRPTGGDLSNELRTLNNRVGSFFETLEDSLSKQGDLSMSTFNKAELDKRRSARFAYFLGTEEPTAPGTRQYSSPEDAAANTIRETQDKQMVGKGMEPGTDGLAGNGTDTGPDLAQKEQLLRAEQSTQGKDVTSMLNAEQLAQRREQRRQAYPLGTEEQNTHGVTYPSDPTAQTVRDTQDKQMVGKGMEPGTDGLAGNGTDGGPDLPKKTELLRAKLRGRFIEADKAEDSRWDFFAGTDKVLSATTQEIWGDQLHVEAKDEAGKSLGKTNLEVVASEEYALGVIRAIREEGIQKVAYLLKGDATITKEAQMALEPEMPMDAGMDPAMEMPAEDPAMAADQEALGLQSEISVGLDEIEQIIAKIRELVSETEAHEYDEMGLDEFGEFDGMDGLEGDLGEANTELGAMSKLELAKIVEAKETVREALVDAGQIVKKANSIVAKVKAYKPKTEAAWAVNDALDHSLYGNGKVTAVNADDGTITVAFEDKSRELIAETGREFKVVMAKVAPAIEPKVGSPEWLQKRSAERRVLAEEQKYDVNGGLQPAGTALVTDAHKDHLNKNIAPSGSGDGGVVENIIEQQQKDMEAVSHTPRGETTAAAGPKAQVVTAAAEKCEKCDKEPCACDEKKDGKEAKAAIEVTEATPQNKFAGMEKEELRKLAEVDAEAKSYWNGLYGEGDGGSSAFAHELTAEFQEEQRRLSAADKQAYKDLVKRAYNLSTAMQEKGLIAEGSDARETQVEKLMGFDTKAFESFASTIETIKPVGKITTASVNPSSGPNTVPRVGVGESQKSFTGELSDLGWT